MLILWFQNGSKLFICHILHINFHFLSFFVVSIFFTIFIVFRNDKRDVMESDQSMMTEIRSAGLDLASVEELKSQLKQYSGGKLSSIIIVLLSVLEGVEIEIERRRVHQKLVEEAR